MAIYVKNPFKPGTRGQLFDDNASNTNPIVKSDWGTESFGVNWNSLVSIDGGTHGSRIFISKYLSKNEGVE